MKLSTSHLSGPLGFGLLLLAAVISIRAIAGSGIAGVPPIFHESLTYEEATQRAQESGKPILVFATADWCGPCQTFKKGALSDAAVIKTATASTIPVYVDIDVRTDLAQQFEVRGIPAMIMIRDGRIIDRFEGVRSAGATRAWLDQAAAK